jgi:hypothetical protein
MSERMRELEARKQLLIAQSRLHRLEVQAHVAALRQSIRRPKTILSIAASSPLRPLIFSALLAVVGRGRLSKVLKGAMAVLGALKALRIVSAWLAQSPAASKAEADHQEWLIDEAEKESFPASDPSAIAQPHAARR